MAELYLVHACKQWPGTEMPSLCGEQFELGFTKGAKSILQETKDLLRNSRDLTGVGSKSKAQQRKAATDYMHPNGSRRQWNPRRDTAQLQSRWLPKEADTTLDNSINVKYMNWSDGAPLNGGSSVGLFLAIIPEHTTRDINDQRRIREMRLVYQLMEGETKQTVSKILQKRSEYVQLLSQPMAIDGVAVTVIRVDPPHGITGIECFAEFSLTGASVKKESQRHICPPIQKMIDCVRNKRQSLFIYVGIIVLLSIFSQVSYDRNESFDPFVAPPTLNSASPNEISGPIDFSITTSENPKTLYGAEGWFTVNISNVTSPQLNDVIAVYCPADENLIKQRHLPYKFAVRSSSLIPYIFQSRSVVIDLQQDGTMLGPDYLEHGRGFYRFHVVNPHESFRVAFFQRASKATNVRPHSDGGFEKNNLVLMSEELSFENPNMPTQVHLALTGLEGQMNIMWLTSDGVEDQHVLFENTDGSLLRSEANSTRYDLCGWPGNSVGFKNPGKIWTVVLTELVPGHRYRYRCGSTATGYSEENTFLGPRGSDDEPLRVIAVADLGKTNVDGSTWHWPLEKEAGVTMDKMMDVTSSSDLMLMVGDTSYAAGSSIQWDEFGHQLSPIASQIPIMMAVGNHEANPNQSGGECSVPYLKRFSRPQNGGDFWYSFDAGSAHFIVFSTEHTFEKKSQQHRWLKEDLKRVNRSVTPFIITAGHRPMYFNEWKDDVKIALQTHLEPLFFRYSVDLSLWGHVHNYYRSCPMYNEACHPRGITHLLIGNGGFNNGKKLKDAPWMVLQDSDHGFVHLTITTSEIGIKYMSNKKGLTDEFVVKKRKRLGGHFLVSLYKNGKLSSGRASTTRGV
ncbi:putative inactive purple acid phosphatase 27-like [Planoprotostelium fungivorum]|uniref:Purple acid phosphatase n=1 Tax=Planoprotostelium fungivorum TaxID=1890364 RepID=A0A2P6NLP3_9EUKA|nr:putative inactive purple acid phosphatase 27-like [Planoprotostelium fungivorum]